MQTKWLHFSLCLIICYQLMATESYEKLYQPITFTNQGFQNFLQEIYNHPAYARQILPHSLAHLIQFLNHGYNTKQPRIYTKSAFRLFNNKLKSSRYLNPNAFIELLQIIPSFLEYQFVIYKTDKTHQLKNVINEILYNAFLQKYALFEEDPHALFNMISNEIIDSIKSESLLFDDICMDELRFMILAFLEQSISKLVWSPEDKSQTWMAVKQIAEQLEKLMEYNIITDPDDLNDLYVSLIERYCSFLELMQDHIPAHVYADIKQDIENNSCSLLDLESTESVLCDKAKRLIHVLNLGHATALTHNDSVA